MRIVLLCLLLGSCRESMSIHQAEQFLGGDAICGYEPGAKVLCIRGGRRYFCVGRGERVACSEVP